MTELDHSYMESLVLGIQDGDSNAFAELYAATYKKQYRFAYNYLKDVFLAQDAIQETYILVLKNIHTIKDPKLFLSWLNQICFRVCFRLYRKQKRFNDELTEYANNSSGYSEKSGSNPENQAITIDEEQYIVKQILNLPFSESEAIVLRYYHDMKIDEIADLMSTSRSSVKRYIRNGQNRLRNLLGQ